MSQTVYTERTYREKAIPEDLFSFRVVVNETDLWIAADRDLTGKALESIHMHRTGIENYIAVHPAFATTLKVWEQPVPPRSIVARMVDAGNAVGIGPMAAVAGSIAEAVARDLIGHTTRVMVENGGDLYLYGGTVRSVGLWAGPSPLSGRVALAVDPSRGVAVCTSSGTVGPSLSLGMADAATVISPSGALADATATELGNRIRNADDMEKSLDWALSVPGVTGAVVIIGETIGAKGNVELVPLGDPRTKNQDPKGD
jgi:ApbE superfamily uncharacterized protein (UPF0280 family)